MDNTLSFNGHTAEIRFSGEDELFYGKLLNTSDLVIFGGKSVDQLKNNFQSAVKDYESAVDLLNESKKVRKILEPPMLEFYRISEKQDNPFDKFVTGQQTFKEGDFVGGSWVNCDGRTYYQEGKIVLYPKTGLWVESENGITEIKHFFTMHKIKDQ